MISTQNVFSPAHGNPVISPTQDMVLGLYYVTVGRAGLMGEGKVFGSPQDAILAYDMGKLHLHSQIVVRFPGQKTILQSRSPSEQITNGRIKKNVCAPLPPPPGPQ